MTWTVPIYYSCLIICYVNLSSHVHVFTRKLILVQIVISYHCLFPNWIQSYCQLNYGIDIRESDLWSDHSKHHTKLACVNYLSNNELYLKRRHCHNLVLIYGTKDVLCKVFTFLSKTSPMLHNWHASGMCTMKAEHRIYTDILFFVFDIDLLRLFIRFK